MDVKKIKSFIHEIIYDFQTIEYLLEYGRIKETVPIMEQILEHIQLFRSQMKAGPRESLFHEAFWDKIFEGKLRMRDLRDKIGALAQTKGPIIEKDLESIGYQRFIEQIRSWAYENIHQLNQIIKSPLHKKMEAALVGLTVLVVGICLVLTVVVRTFQHNWGLGGDFFKGHDFEKHLSTGYNMTIDFRGHSQMAPGLPQNHFSARWQAFLIVPHRGAYTFFVKVDDGVRLFLDGKILIDQWKDNKSAEFEKKIFLSKGEHWLCVEYYNDSGPTVLELYWSFEGGKKEIIPARYLRCKAEFFTNHGLKEEVLRFTPHDVESGKGWIQKLDHHSNWPLQDHLLANNSNGPISVVKYFVIPQRGRYLVTIFHDSAEDFIDAKIKISSIVPLQVPMQTWSPVPIYSQDSYVCEFPAGKNSIRIFGVGDPKKRFLGVNSVVLRSF